MKKILTFLLLAYFGISSVIPHAHFSQLQKIPELHEHYLEHKAEAKEKGLSFTFIEFIKWHFLSDISHEHDDFNHDALPFVHCQNCIQLFLNDCRDLLRESRLQYAQADFNSLQLHYFYIYMKNIDQPPILA